MHIKSARDGSHAHGSGEGSKDKQPTPRTGEPAAPSTAPAKTTSKGSQRPAGAPKSMVLGAETELDPKVSTASRASATASRSSRSGAAAEGADQALAAADSAATEEEAEQPLFDDEFAESMRTLPMQARITHVPLLGHRISQSGFMVQQPARYWSLPPRRVFAVAADGSLEPFDLAATVCDRLTAATGYRMVLNGCMCRVGLGCANFPQDLGCLGMGEALRPTPLIDGREVDHEGAMRHVQWALDEGLVPTVAWEWDVQVYGGPMDRGLILCFCDYCHCDLRLSAREGTGRFRRKYAPVPGLTPHVDVEQCTLCGTCAKEDVCCVAAVSLGEEASRIDPDLCIRCSRCADVCPEVAISFRLQDPEHVVERLMDEIAEVTDFISTEPVEYGKRA